MILGSSIINHFKKCEIPWNVKFYDYKSLPDINNWRAKLHAYGIVKYGNMNLTKYIIGDGINRLEENLHDTDIICITSNFTYESNITSFVVKFIKEFNDNAIIIVGGRDASARTSYYHKNGVDIVAIGDSDISLPSFLSDIYFGNKISNLNNNILVNNDQHINMDDIPFLNFDLIKSQKYSYIECGGGNFFQSILDSGFAAYYETSRGCVRECNFCTERLTIPKFLGKNHFYKDIVWYKKNNVSMLMFCDDNLLYRMNHSPDGESELIDMFDFLRDNNLSWEFPVGLEIGKLFNKKTKKLRQPLINSIFWNNDIFSNYKGVFRLLLPLENVFQNMNQKTPNFTKLKTIDIYIQILEAIIATGIPQINIGVIWGWPYESKERLNLLQRGMSMCNELLAATNRNSIRKIKTKINFSVFCLTPLPGTPLYTEFLKEKRIKYDINKHPELWSLHTAVIDSNNYKSYEITDIRRSITNQYNSSQDEGKVTINF